MKFSRRTLFILALFSAVFLITQWVFIPGTYTRLRIVQALQAPKVLLQALSNRHKTVVALTELALENQSLRGQLAQMGNEPSIIKNNSRSYIYARIYSTYPNNNADKILINVGSEHGVTVGAVALAAPGVFLGEVVAVNEKTSEVRTLYDSNLDVPVKIGDAKIDALLEGGHDPKLTLISKKKLAQSGQTVVTAAQQYAYGLILGTVADLHDSDNHLFQEATLQPPYIISELNDVYIVR